MIPIATVTTNGVTNSSWAWWNQTYPNYVPLASDQAGNCDVFGPLCQTGTVTVGVNLSSTTTTTVIPCSSYLSQQASSIAPDWGSEYPLDIYPYEMHDWPDTYLVGKVFPWLSSFGHSPQCTSFGALLAPEFFEAAPTTTSGAPPIITPAPELPGCASGLSGPWQAYIPPRVVNSNGPSEWSCCGICTLNVPRVRVVYFPDESAAPCSAGPSAISQGFSAYGNTSEPPSLPASNGEGLVTAVYSGHTLYANEALSPPYLVQL